jgi:predicted choloylglycine hydrolase
MRKTKSVILVFSVVVFGLPLLLCAVFFAIGAYLYFTADFLQPKVDVDLHSYEFTVHSDSLRTCDDDHLLLNEHGLWEARISGNAVERGAKYGVLCEDLLAKQEHAFVDQIHEMIPSDFWVDFLHKLIIISNRNMAQHIPQEYREEIYSISLSCTDRYNSYGSPYVRQLNYHAAHDIGHAMQEYMLVGCSSFACWAEQSEEGSLIVGRNFDFYVGDNFAKNKVVLFVEPDSGYKFASISWPGMMGVLSGMNEKGLTITINAAKGKIPTSSAMPISLLARNILQYASNIEEAYAIAQGYETFVSESLLIGSASDNCAAIIEKTPSQIALYKSDTSRVMCTNHYQSSTFAFDEYNVENIATSDSPYRYARVAELLDATTPLNVHEAAGILRDRYGKGGADIGLGSEKSINQFIAHHSVVFEPSTLRFWVSTSPWQLGEYVCYDLNNVFGGDVMAQSFVLPQYNIPCDSLALGDEYVRVCRYREQYKSIVSAIEDGGVVSSDFQQDFISNNPNYFQVYNTLGDYEQSKGRYKEAVAYWQKALSLEIPRAAEREDIISKIQKYD